MGDSQRGKRVQIQPAGWGWRPARDGASLFFGPAGAGGCGGGFGSVLPLGGQDVYGQRRQRYEVKSQRQRALGSPAARKMGGHRPYLCGARARLGSGADRREARPDAGALCSGSWPTAAWVVSYYALWHFLQHEGVTFKKVFAPPNRTDRTSPGGGTVEGASGGGSIRGGWSLSTKPGPRPT